jgi:hypothetical protein
LYWIELDQGGSIKAKHDGASVAAGEQGEESRVEKQLVAADFTLFQDANIDEGAKAVRRRLTRRYFCRHQAGHTAIGLDENEFAQFARIDLGRLMSI